MAHGESTAWSIEQFGEDKIRDELSSLTGVIAVSTRNKNLLIEKGTVPEQKIKVFPNGYRPERFYQRDKTEARERFGWDKDAFIAGFCGVFVMNAFNLPLPIRICSQGILLNTTHGRLIH